GRLRWSWAEVNWRKHVATEDRDRRWWIWRVSYRQGPQEYRRADYLDRPYQPSSISTLAVSSGDIRFGSWPDWNSDPRDSSESEEHHRDPRRSDRSGQRPEVCFRQRCRSSGSSDQIRLPNFGHGCDSQLLRS